MPLFSSAYPRDGRKTYKDAFWIVAVNVQGASREFHHHVFGDHKNPPGHPPPLKSGQWSGHFRGRGLLLTRAGNLASAELEGFLPRSGVPNDRSMDVLFHDVGYDEAQLLYEDWGFFNRGRWRRDRRAPTKFHGLQTTDWRINFEENWFNSGPRDRTGKGTSATLSRYVKSGGAIQWPRNFADMDAD
ncbi:hypothetical protein [Nocardioides flavescens]|uniref:Uncharacterized protein n=1 Tax=Nocardioides flavescens TaxID=2691959 RepID=A0A6L7F0I1_9ACTN|nr:hypothetical protein [Nocardioides flavescens]MXG90339.1 hypothetical protein [Nocardioides flavescens]